MRQDLLFTSLACCLIFGQHVFAASGDTKKIHAFCALIAWAQKNGVRQNLGGGIPETVGANTRRIKLNACSFNEIEANAKHVFCVGTFPNYRKFIFFILMDVGDGTAIVWRVSSRGKLISTMCTAAGAVQAVPNAAFGAGFLAEKEYFFRTMRRPNPRNHVTAPPANSSIP